jgi:ubiquinone/menaquinone biosynthesis C-methylase UbiE
MTPKNDPSLYDKEYFEAHQHFYSKQRFYFFIGIIVELGIKTVLDVGCGPNTMCKLLRDIGVDAVGLDFSPDSDADVIASVTDIPFEDDSFDLVFSADTLEHLEPVQIPPALDECKRVAKRQIHHICFEEDDTQEYNDKYHPGRFPRLWWLNEFSKRDIWAESEYTAWVNPNVGPVPMMGIVWNRCIVFKEKS